MRDRIYRAQLTSLDWAVVRIWGYELKSKPNTGIKKINNAIIKSNNEY